MLQAFLDIQGFLWEGKPVLMGANEENKKLDESLKQKKTEVQKMKGLLEGEREREKVMAAHYADLQQEINYIQQMKAARMHELEIEESTQKLLERERSRLMQEIDEMKKEIEAIQNRKKNREAVISEQKEKCDALKAAVEIEEEALLKWLKESANLENDKIALIKYTHQDDCKIKDLSLTLERLGKEAKERKTALDNVDTDVVIAQSELDRLQGEFRKVHAERQGIVSNWEKVLLQLQKRNKEMDSLSKQISDMKEETETLTQKLNGQKLMLAAEKENNRDLQRQIAERESYASKLRNLSQEESKRESDLFAELQTLRNISTYTSYQVQNMRKSIKQLEDILEQRDKKLEEMEEARLHLRNQINDLSKETFDADHYAKELEKLLHREKTHLYTVENELCSLQNAVLKYTQNLKEVLEKEKAMETQMKGAQVANRNLSHNISKLDSNRLTQQTLLHKVCLSIEQVEKKIRLMEGEMINEEERLRMEEEKSRLQGILNDKTSALSFLTEQVKTMREKIDYSVRNLALSKKQNLELAERIDFLDFFITNSQKSLKLTREKKEGLLVDECLVKLQISRYQELLRQKNDSVMDLQRNQVEFEAVIKERILELKTCKDMINMEVRREEEECYQINRQFQEYSDKVDKLQTRYEVILQTLGMPGATDTTHAELLIKAEDEKRMLKQERDELLAQVMQSEEDLHALRNTLWLIKESTERFRQALNPPGLTSEENQKLKSLEKELMFIEVEVRDTLERLQDVNDVTGKIERSLAQRNEEQKQLQAILYTRMAENTALRKEMNDLEEKQLRADRSNSRLSVEVVQKAESGIEDDLRIRLLRELRKAATDTLFSAIEDNPKLVDQLKTAFEEADLPLPLRVRTSNSSRCNFTPFPRLHTGGSITRLSTSTSRQSSGASRSRGTYTPSVVSIGSDFPGS